MAVALEDSINGVRAAKRAGMIAVAVPCPATDHMVFTEADHVLTTLKGIGPKELRALRG
jgi:beta-phosphoglucomutase-like phosphatase (HAD superfamily)